MAKLDPQQAEQVMLNAGCKPLEPFTKSHAKWKCMHISCGQIIYPSYHSISQGQGGCLHCGQRASINKRKLSESDVLIVMKNANLQPLEPYSGVSTPWRSKCLNCEKTVSPTITNIRNGQNGCGYCSGHFVDSDDAVIKMNLANLLPLVKYTKSHDKWRCKCLTCGKVVFPTFNSIQQGNGGCKFCAKKFVDSKEVEKFMIDKGVKPLEPYQKANSRWNCECLICGKLVSPTYASIRSGNGGCKFCAGMIIEPEVAVAQMMSVKLKPLTPFKNGSTKWKCECLVCGKIVYQTYNQMKQGYGPCGFCAGKVVDVEDAIKLMKSADLKPLENYSKALEKWKCECQKCGRIVYPTYSAIKKGQGGCRFCAQIGIDYTGPGFIYLMTHPILESHKIGIGGSKRSRNRDRVADHQKFGWKLYERKDLNTADDAFQVEQNILNWLRLDKKLGVYLSEFEMPQGGYSETIDASEIDLTTIWAKVEELSRMIK